MIEGATSSSTSGVKDQGGRRATRRASSGLLRLAVYTAAALPIFVSWVGVDWSLQVTHYRLRNVEATVPAMIHGEAEQPWVRRTLVPSTALLIRSAVPDSVADWLVAKLDTGALRRAAREFRVPRRHFLESLIGIALSYVALVGFPLAFRVLAKSLYEFSLERTLDLLALVALCMLPAFFGGFGAHTLYDFPALTLFTLGLTFLWRRQWVLFYAVYALALWNKETTFLLSVPFFAHLRCRMSAPALALHLSGQLVLFGATLTFLLNHFGQNPGSAIEFHLADNLRAIFTTLEPRGVGTWGVLALALFGIRGKCPFLRDCAWVLAPFLGLYLVGGIYGEIRVLYETFPIVLLLGLESLALAVRRPLTQARLPGRSSA